MDLKFFGIFLGFAIVLELITTLSMLKTINKIRDKNYDKIDTKITVNKIKEGYSRDSEDHSFNYAIYEWIYNGKKRRLHIDDSDSNSPLLRNHAFMYWGGSYPEKLEITINKRNGKYKRPEGSKRVYLLNVLVFLFSCIIAYYLAVKITGTNPLFS